MMFLLKKKKIFLMMIMMMFSLNNKVIMKLKKMAIEKQFPTHLQKGKSEDEIDEKIYKEPNLETAVEIEKQAIIDEEKFIKAELDEKKVNLKISKEAEIKKCKTFLTK